MKHFGKDKLDKSKLDTTNESYKISRVKNYTRNTKIKTFCQFRRE